MSRNTANLLLLLTGAVWGMGFIAQQTAMEDMPAVLFIAIRFLLAGAVVAPIAWSREWRREDRPCKTNWLQFMILGGVFFLAMSLQQLGLLKTTVTNAGFLTTLYVVVVPCLLLVAFRERQPLMVWISSIVSIIGIYLLSNGSLTGLNWGDLLIVICAVFWAVQVIMVGIFADDTKWPVTMAATQFTVCGMLGLVTHFVLGSAGVTTKTFSSEMLVAALPEVLYAGVLSGGFAFTLQIVAQQYTSPSIAAILMGTESLFAAVFGAILLGDRLNATGYVGCGLIFAAVMAVELMPSSKKPDDVENDDGQS